MNLLSLSLFAPLSGIIVALPTAAAAAVALPGDLNFSGQMDLDPDDLEFRAPNDSTSSGSGTFFARVGGVDSGGSFMDEVITGSPVDAVLTEVGDGFGGTVTPSTGAATGPAFVNVNNPGGGPARFFIDPFLGDDGGIPLTISNTSLTDSYFVSLSLTYTHTIDAGGNDAFGESDLELKVDDNEIFNFEVISDSLFGNSINDSTVPGLGGPVSSSGVESFILTIAPAGSIEIAVDHTIFGQALQANSSIAGSASYFLSVDSATVVPEPSLGLLASLGIGSALLRIRRRR